MRTVKANTIIIGAGAAGMACAVRLVQCWRAQGIADAHKRVLVVTADAAGGASRRSGSDKQTYYKLGAIPYRADDALSFAEALTAGGCCHGDNALVEAVGSLRSFHMLCELGVPFPHDALGAYAGYRTDHDPCGRATSAGPKTSRFMAEALAAEARRLGVAVLDRQTIVEFITRGAGSSRRIAAAVALDERANRGGSDGVPLTLLCAENWVLAAGGPGALFADTVYPHGQWGLHGPALAAGLAACNLSEWQFGLASVKFRWNVSGTYMQAVPRIFSTDASGDDEREFLCDFFPDMASMATAIFLKGYQWPFDAARAVGGGSSLIDLAVERERRRGRRVWLDYRRNPQGPRGWGRFDIAKLAPEARDYLRAARASQKLPIDRLRHMNSPAIELYAEHKIDLEREPLEVAVCAQHNNGGFAVDSWWESSVAHTFVIGEMAGTHGVKRPGGAALNAGQVGALRAAQRIAHAYGPDVPQRPTQAVVQAALRVAEQLHKPARAKDAPTPRQALAEIAARMTASAGHMRSLRQVELTLRKAVEQHRAITTGGLRAETPVDLRHAVLTRQQSLTAVAVLKAIAELLRRGGGSRGSYCVLGERGSAVHGLLIDPQTGKQMRIVPENKSLRDEIIELRYNPRAREMFDVRIVAPRPIPHIEQAFETMWRQFRDASVYTTLGRR